MFNIVINIYKIIAKQIVYKSQIDLKNEGELRHSTAYVWINISIFDNYTIIHNYIAKGICHH